MMRHCENNRIGWSQCIQGCQVKVILLEKQVVVCCRIVQLNRDPEILKLTHDIDNPRIANVGYVLLECDPEHSDKGLTVPRASHNIPRDSVRHIDAHSVIHSAPGMNDMRMIADFLRFVGDVERIDADAMSANQTRTET